MDVELTIRSYLPQVIHMSLATCVDNKPWVCELHYVFDDELNLYFRSTSARRHSQEIAKNPNVSGNIVTQHFLNQTVRGVYFEGAAEMLDNVDENHIAYKLCCERFNKTSAILEDAKKDDGHKFYKITVNKFYLFDGYGPASSQKYILDWKS